MEPDSTDRVFELAAELFALLAAPTRLRIVCELCQGERNVGELLARIGVSQPNMSQHLGMLNRARVLDRRREGAQMFYRVVSRQVLLVCEAICSGRDRPVGRRRSAAQLP